MVGVTRTRAWPGLIERYRDRLPVGPSTPVVTLLEGGTPLVLAPVLVIAVFAIGTNMMADGIAQVAQRGDS